jgi:hypothetical protein
VQRVLAFADGKLVASERPKVPRLDVAENLGRPALFSGYRFFPVLAGSEDVAADPDRLRVFAVLGDRASELKRLSTAGD